MLFTRFPTVKEPIAPNVSPEVYAPFTSEPYVTLCKAIDALLVGLLKLIDGAVPLQIVVELFVTSKVGFGLTATVVVKVEAFEHPFPATVKE